MFPVQVVILRHRLWNEYPNVEQRQDGGAISLLTIEGVRQWNAGNVLIFHSLVFSAVYTKRQISQQQQQQKKNTSTNRGGRTEMRPQDGPENVGILKKKKKKKRKEIDEISHLT